MIDIHCHFLPAADDGSQSWDITLEMCRMAERDGATHNQPIRCAMLILN
jgi:tyrosine-protein phosphatase YwqE